MSQSTSLGDAEVSGMMKVTRVNGDVVFYKLVDGNSIEITEAEYREAGGE